MWPPTWLPYVNSTSRGPILGVAGASWTPATAQDTPASTCSSFTRGLQWVSGCGSGLGQTEWRHPGKDGTVCAHSGPDITLLTGNRGPWRATAGFVLSSVFLGLGTGLQQLAQANPG